MYIDIVQSLLAMHIGIVIICGNSASKKNWYEQGSQPLRKRLTPKIKQIYYYKNQIVSLLHPLSFYSNVLKYRKA